MFLLGRASRDIAACARLEQVPGTHMKICREIMRGYSSLKTSNVRNVVYVGEQKMKPTLLRSALLLIRVHYS